MVPTSKEREREGKGREGKGRGGGVRGWEGKEGEGSGLQLPQKVDQEQKLKILSFLAKSTDNKNAEFSTIKI